MTGIALALALRGLDRALDAAAIVDARVELLGWHLSRQVVRGLPEDMQGGVALWGSVLWGARR